LRVATRTATLAIAAIATTASSATIVSSIADHGLFEFLVEESR
jgi:hypothetical protein